MSAAPSSSRASDGEAPSKKQRANDVLGKPEPPIAVSNGQPIQMENGVLRVPFDPIIPFIEGDGTGPDIWAAARRVLDAAVQKAYRGKRHICWMEVYAGEKSFRRTGSWLPQETLDAYKKYLIGIKGPLTTPIGQGHRSLNVALRRELDLYTCLRPVRWFKGVPSPVKDPSKVDMVIFRENIEDIYAGIEVPPKSEKAARLWKFLSEELKIATPGDVPFPADCAFGIKPISIPGTERLVRAAILYALKNHRRSVTLVHKGNIQKFTEGGFKNWAYNLAKREFRDRIVTERESWIISNKDGGVDDIEENASMVEPGFSMMTAPQQQAILDEVQSTLSALYATHGLGKWREKLLIKDVIADIMLQHVLVQPQNFDVIATTNLNGDYLSDALAAQVGGIGIAPGGNINYLTGHAVFEATHGTAPRFANLDVVNPGSVILSGEMMLRHMGWSRAANVILLALDRTIACKQVTFDFAHQMEGAKKLKTSEFGDAMIEHMDEINIDTFTHIDPSSFSSDPNI